MIVRAIANGNVLDLSDEQARLLIDAGIYEPAPEGPRPKARRRTPRAPRTPQRETATED